MNDRRKEVISFAMIFLGIFVAIFGASTFGSFLITNIFVNKIMKININLGTIDLIVRITLLVIGFFIAVVGAIIFRKMDRK